MKISHFLLDNTEKMLTIEFIEDPSGSEVKLSFEFLRVCGHSHELASKKTSNSQVVSHKKNVLLTAIECVGKHGYRLIFNDGYSAVFSDEHLHLLFIEQLQRWHGYLQALQASGHSREAMIDIKQI
jgi:DUF971 family protein